jgi:hypothetical protein
LKKLKSHAGRRISCAFYEYHVLYGHSTHTHNCCRLLCTSVCCLVLVNQLDRHCCLASWNPQADTCHISQRSLPVDRHDNNLVIIISMQSETHLQKDWGINHPFASHGGNYSLVLQVAFTQVPNGQNNPLYDHCKRRQGTTHLLYKLYFSWNTLLDKCNILKTIQESHVSQTYCHVG